MDILIATGRNDSRVIVENGLLTAKRNPLGCVESSASDGPSATRQSRHVVRYDRRLPRERNSGAGPWRRISLLAGAVKVAEKMLEHE